MPSATTATVQTVVRVDSWAITAISGERGWAIWSSWPPHASGLAGSLCSATHPRYNPSPFLTPRTSFFERLNSLPPATLEECRHEPGSAAFWLSRVCCYSSSGATLISFSW